MATGQQALSAQFLSIGTNGCWLTSIVPEGLANKSMGQISIQVLNSSGMPTATYNYYKNGTAPYNKGTGWYKGTTIIAAGVNDVNFPAGQGLWVKGLNTAQLTMSGEVLTKDLTIPLSAGQQMLGNPFPIDVKLTSIVPDGLANKSMGQISIQTLNSSGMPTATYNYYKNGTAPYNKGTGWYKGTAIIQEGDTDVDIPAGIGLWVKGIANTSLTFKKTF